MRYLQIIFKTEILFEGIQMKTLTADLSSILIPEGYIEIYRAAHTLNQYLGEDVDHWLDFLRTDLYGSRCEDGDNELSWQNIEGLPYCFARDLYFYIARKDPKSIGIGTSEALDEKHPFFEDCSATVHVDYEHGGRLLVRFGPYRGQEDASLLTACEALVLAQNLLNAAQYCEMHDYNFGTKEMEKKSPRSGAKLIEGVLGNTGNADMGKMRNNLEATAGVPS